MRVRLLVVTLAVTLLGACAGREVMQPRVHEPGPILPVTHPVDPAESCLDEGQEWSAEDGARSCCEGLVRVDVTKNSLLRFDQCFVAEGERYLCARCGNGRCGLGENTCNCPADCAVPAAEEASAH